MKIVFYVTEDWYFCSHRLPVAMAAKAAGYDVVVVTRVSDYGDRIKHRGLKLIDLKNERGGVNPFLEWLTVLRLVRIYRNERPDLVHHVAVKPVLYGSLAALFAGVPRVVNALAGLGWLYSSDTRRARALKQAIHPLFCRLLRRSTVIVQNTDDSALIRALGVNDVRLIRGSGVDAERFAPSVTEQDPPTVVLVARLLRDKGVKEFADAARLLKSRGIGARFVLVGLPILIIPPA